MRTGLLLAAVGAVAAAYGGLWLGYAHWQLALWLLGLALLPAAFPGARTAPAEAESWTPVEAAALAAIVLLGAFFRIHRLDVLPPGLWIDEVYVSTRAAQLLHEKPFLPFGASPLTWLEQWVQTSNLYLYSVGLIFLGLGFGFWQIKLISILPGVAGVPALYLFARQLAGKRTALCAGVLFAAGHWNARLSRWGWDEVAMTTLQIVSACFLVRGFRRGERRSFVISGIAMGLCLYTYVAARLALAAALACLGAHALAGRGPRRERLAALAIFTLATLLTIAPLSVFYLEHPHLFDVRTSEASIFRQVQSTGSWEPLLNNARKHLGMFHLEGDVFAKHNLPYAPMLDTVTGILFAAGAAIALWRWRDAGYLLCHCWLWFGLLGGILSDTFGHPHAYRTGNVAPVTAVLAALPLGWLLGRFRPAPDAGPARRTIPAAVAAAALLAAVALNYQNLFVQWARVETLWDETMTSPGTNVARRILAEDDERSVFVARYVSDGALGLLVFSPYSGNQARASHWNLDYWNGDTNPPFADGARDIVYYLDPRWRRWLELWYPGARWEELRNEYGAVYAVRAEIPAADIRATQGLRRTVWTGGTDTEPPSPELDGLAGTWTLFDGYVHLRLPGFVTFGAADAVLAGIWFDGRRVLDAGDQVSEEVSAEVGLHSISILLPGAVDEPPAILARQRWTRGGEIPIDSLSPPSAPERAGLRATFFAGPDAEGPPLLEIEAGRPTVIADHPATPYSAVWRGTLDIEVAGEYVIGAAMDDGGSLSLGGELLFEVRNGYAEKTLHLDRGPQPIELRYFDVGAGAYLSLLWLPPLPLREKETFPPEHWGARGFLPISPYRLPFAGRGLRARYWANTEFEGAPFLTALENRAWIAHHQGERFSLELDGAWYFPESGIYELGLNSDDGSWLHLDGELVLDHGGIHGFGVSSTKVHVERGVHAVRVRYFQDTGGAGLHLLWARDGEELEPVLPPFLHPAGGADLAWLDRSLAAD